MAAFSSTLEVGIINYLRGTDLIAPVSLTLHLYTADPADDDSGAEVGAAIGYTPQAVVLSAPGSVVGTGSTSSNTATIVFGPATGPWGVVTHWGIKNPGLVLQVYGQFLAGRDILTGESYTVPAGTLELLVR